MVCSAMEMPVKTAAGERHDDVDANGRSATTIGEDGCPFSSEKAVRRRVRDRALPTLRTRRQIESG
jgi:hypothetical protein